MRNGNAVVLVICFGSTLTAVFYSEVVKTIEGTGSAEPTLPIPLQQRPVAIGGILRSFIFVRAGSRQKLCL